MIEIIQQTEKTEENLENKLPKNIRQIGNPEKDFRIYMEDYVYTYLHPAQIHGMEVGILPRLLILVGEIDHFSNRSCAFISGAIQVENHALSEDVPELDERAWRQIHKEIQCYFEKCEIVGWVLDIPGNTLAVTKEMEEIHRKNFMSPYQFFFLMDSREREEAFYTWKNGTLSKKEGYFIYYEKNPQMQEYMISRREAIYGEMPPTEEVEDQAARNYRAMMLEKKEHTYKRRTGFLAYLTSILMVVVLCSVSVILISSIHKMENMEQTISTMSVAMESTEQTKENEANQVAVETISGNVFPIEEAAEAAGGTATATRADSTEGTNEATAGTGADDATEATATGTGTEGAAGATTTTGTEGATGAATATGTESAAGATAATTGTEQTTGASQENKTAAAVPTMTEAETYLAQGYYIVQEGDNLEKICYKIYQTYAMLNAICEANGISDKDNILVGQKIILP